MQPTGAALPQRLPRAHAQRTRGAGVLVPGPGKLLARAEEKVRNDYAGAAFPTAASLLDVVRCSIVLDDPYALAVQRQLPQFRRGGRGERA